MSSRRLVAAIAAGLFALVGLLPASALAADGPDVSGTVTKDGAPVAGASVLVALTGSDMVFTATTDTNGAWGVQAGVGVGNALTITATGPMFAASPDAQGCVKETTPTGRLELTVDALPLAPIALPLDSAVTSTVCSATATPHAAPTPPATDAGTGATPGSGTGPLLAVLALATIAWLAVGAVARRGARHA